jgi:hypothetical protein
MISKRFLQAKGRIEYRWKPFVKVSKLVKLHSLICFKFHLLQGALRSAGIKFALINDVKRELIVSPDLIIRIQYIENRYELFVRNFSGFLGVGKVINHPIKPCYNSYRRIPKCPKIVVP